MNPTIEYGIRFGDGDVFMAGVRSAAEERLAQLRAAGKRASLQARVDGGAWWPMTPAAGRAQPSQDRTAAEDAGGEGT